MKQKIKRSILTIIATVLVIATTPATTFAGPPPPVPCSPTPGQGVDIGKCAGSNFSGGAAPSSIGSFLTTIIGQVYTVALIVMLIYLIWGSYRYMMSAGDPKAVSAARGHLTWAIVGMIIVFVSYWIFKLVNELALHAFQTF